MMLGKKFRGLRCGGPHSLATVTVGVGGIEALLVLGQLVLHAFDRHSPALAGLVSVIGGVLAVCFLGLGIRWVRRVALWRLRNRLILTYVFIGVIPVVLLMVMAIVTVRLFNGQFATFIVTSELRFQLNELEAVNETVAATVVSSVAAGTMPDKAVQSIRFAGSQRSLTVWAPGAGEPSVYTLPAGAAATSKPLPSLAQKSSSMVIEQGLHLRAWQTVTAGSRKLIVILSEPVQPEMLGRLAGDVGEITLNPPVTGSTPGEEKDLRAYNPGVRETQADPTPRIEPLAQAAVRIVAGSVGTPKGRWDRVVGFGMSLKAVDWHNGGNFDMMLSVRTRPSLLYGRLFSALGEFAGGTFTLLAMVALFFALIELVALITGIRLARTMTGSVAALYDATQHVNRGDLKHRIQVVNKDQLAALEMSFNSMTESMEKLIAERTQVQRWESELAIAQEVQAQLFPSESSPQLASLEVHGVCLPARTVSGDYYDFLPLGNENMGLAVGDISGKGISAALMMANLHSAVRVYEFGSVPPREAARATDGGSVVPEAAIRPPAAMLELLNLHLNFSTAPEKYATLFFAIWHGASHRLTYSNGGHPPPLIIGADGSMHKLETGGTVIGLLNHICWDEATIEMRPGDLLVAYSDGVTEPENEKGEFGAERLAELIRANRNLPLTSIAESVISAVQAWIGTAELPDDMLLVLARAR
jgi:phosphoserine phosphatase RsbU/P